MIVVTTVVVVVMVTVVVVVSLVVVLTLVALEVVVVEVVVAVVAVVVIVEAVVTVEVNDLVGAGGVIDTLAGVLLIGVLINMLNAAMIALDFAVKGSCSADVLSDGAVGLLRDSLDGVLSAVVIGGLSDIGVDVSVDVNVSAAFAGVEFVMLSPLERFGC